MSNQVKGKAVKILQPQTGTGKNGAWVKQEFIIETSDQYPKKICLTAWGTLATVAGQLELDEQVEVSFNAESREHNERWYTELKVWKIDRLGFNETDNKPKKESLSKKEDTIIDDLEEDTLPF
jgi:hypothetical protein